GFDWMARYFFSGGIMPSNDLLLNFDKNFKLEQRWEVQGTHYQKTSEAWLANMDQHRAEIMPILKDTYGKDYKKWWVYWRVFFISCAELWGYENGSEWMVSHYLFNKKEI
ncbi:MAG: cyclopropane-fatty-acyl-phospholipid synthase, partial [Candidatus Omnitrophota bacterium]